MTAHSTPLKWPQIPLAEAMRPQRLSHVVGQTHLLGAGKPLAHVLNSKQAHSMILWGPPGVGKTTLAYRVCEAANLRAVECNASHVRNRAGVSEIIQPLLQSNNVADFFRPEGHRPLGVILDEIDGMSSGDRGGLTEIIKALKDYTGVNAIFCISNEWADKKYRPLMRLCLSFEVIPPSITEIQNLLIKKHPTVQPSPDTVTELSQLHQGDLRKILQIWSTNIQKYGLKNGEFKKIVGCCVPAIHCYLLTHQ